MTGPTRLFEPDALQFLRDLKDNNDRDWFQPRKEQYERLLRLPMQNAVQQINRALERKAPDYITDPARSVYRVYRDTRFSPDKTPYKTHIGALLWHRKLGKDGGAGLYFHLSTEDLLVAAGLYHAPNDMLLAVRNHIAADYETLTKILRRKSLRNRFGALQGDKLTRPPKGFDPDHPAIEYLKHKDLLLEKQMSPEDALAPGSLNLVTEHLLELVSFIDYLNKPFLGRKPAVLI